MKTQRQCAPEVIVCFDDFPRTFVLCGMFCSMITFNAEFRVGVCDDLFPPEEHWIEKDLRRNVALSL